MVESQSIEVTLALFLKHGLRQPRRKETDSMKTSTNIIYSVQTPIRRLSHWCLMFWDGISGKTQQRLHRLQQRLETSRQHTLELEQQLQEVTQQLSDLRQTSDQSEQREQALQQHNLELEQQLQAINRQLVELRQAHGRSQQRETDLEQQLQANQAQHEQTEQSFKAAIARLEAALEQSQQTRATLEEHWINTNNDYAALQDKQTEYIGFFTLYDNEIQKLESDLASQQIELGSCYVELSRTRAQVMAEGADSEVSQPAPPPLDLSTWKIAMVGGHENMTHGVSEKLQQQYNLKELIKIPSEHVPQQQLKQKLENCDLVVLIIGYINHALTGSINDLKDKKAIKGEVIPINSLGVSGVMRDLISFLETNLDDIETKTNR